MVLQREGNVGVEQMQGIEFIVTIKSFSFTATEHDGADQLVTHFQRAQTAKQFRRDVAIQAQKDFVGARVQQYRALRGGQSVHMLGQERNDRGLRQHGKPV